MSESSKRKKHGRYCSVPGCINRSNTNMTYFSIPAEPERRKRWLAQMGREDYMIKFTRRVLICEAHFNPIDIMVSAGRKVLKKNAWPSLALPLARRAAVAVQVDLSDEEDQLDVPIAAARRAAAQGRLPGVRARRNDVLVTDDDFQNHSEKDKLKKMNNLHRYNFYALCDQYLSKDLTRIVKTYNYLRFNTKDDHYCDAYKKFCWTLHFADPRIYGLLGKMLRLPRVDALKRLWTPISTRMTDDFLLVLKARVDSMSEREKNCSLIVSATSVRAGLCYDTRRDVIVGLQELDGLQAPAAAHSALVLVLRGLLVSWSLPVVYVLLADCSGYDDISVWIDNVVLKLLETGFKIRAIVSDLDSDLTRASRKACVTVREPFFRVGEHKIYHVVDASHLVKRVCCCFRTFDFQFADGSVAKFEHVRQFYELDKSRTVRLAAELTDEHVRPRAVHETDARSAAQVMSATVAAGISILTDFGVIERSATDTVKFLLLMSEFFDCLKNFRGEDAQFQLCDTIQNTFWSLKILDPQNGTDVTKTMDFVEGLRITIRSIALLHEDLEREGFSDVPLTRYLNRDVLETFYAKTRAKCRAKSELTCRQLVSALRKFYSTSILKPIKEPNEDIDVEKFIQEIYEISVRSGIGVNRSIFSPPMQITFFFEISSSDYDRFRLPEKNSLVYICGCLLKKCYDRHGDCDLMKKYVEVSKTALSGSNYTKYQEYMARQESAPPAAPPDALVQHVSQLERVFSESFGSTHPTAAFGAAVYDKIKQIEFSPPCRCFPTIYLHKLFIRMRIYSTIQFNNRTLRLLRNAKLENTNEENINQEFINEVDIKQEDIDQEYYQVDINEENIYQVNINEENIKQEC